VTGKLMDLFHRCPVGIVNHGADVMPDRVISEWLYSGPGAKILHYIPDLFRGEAEDLWVLLIPILPPARQYGIEGVVHGLVLRL